MHTRWLNVMIIAVMLLGMMPFSAQAAPLAETPDALAETSGVCDDPPTVMVDPGLKGLAPDAEIGYLIYLREEPDLSAAFDMDWDARGRYVVKQLQAIGDYNLDWAVVFYMQDQFGEGQFNNWREELCLAAGDEGQRGPGRSAG